MYLTFIHCTNKQITEPLQVITKMMTDALIKTGRPDMSCACACHIGH